MGRTEETTHKSSVWGNAVKLGIAVGAVQALRNDTVRSKVAGAFDRLKNAIRDGADDAGDRVKPTPATYKDSEAAADEGMNSTADISEHLESDERQAATETLKETTENIRHSET